MHVFGNAGALFMTAMTWFDHETESIWSQPWGRAIVGEYKGVELHLLPSQIMTYEDWLEKHPETLVMVNDLERLAPYKGGVPRPDFVIGIQIGDIVKGVDSVLVENNGGVLNETVGPFPVVVWFSEGGYHVYLRQVEETVLTFRPGKDDMTIIDDQTGTVWQLGNGLAVEGQMTGQALLAVPTFSSYYFAWEDFYPDAEFVRP